jgi:hypothetical protein
MNKTNYMTDSKSKKVDDIENPLNNMTCFNQREEGDRYINTEREGVVSDCQSCYSTPQQ